MDDENVWKLARLMYDNFSETSIGGRLPGWSDISVGSKKRFYKRAEFMAGLLKEAETEGRRRERADYGAWYADERGLPSAVLKRYSKERPL